MGELYEERVRLAYEIAVIAWSEHSSHAIHINGHHAGTCKVDDVCDSLGRKMGATDELVPLSEVEVLMADLPEAWDWASESTTVREAAAAAIKCDIDERLFGEYGCEFLEPRDPSVSA